MAKRRSQNDSVAGLRRRLDNLLNVSEAATPRTLIREYLEANASGASSAGSKPSRRRSSGSKTSIRTTKSPENATNNYDTSADSFVLPKYRSTRRQTGITRQRRKPTRADVEAFAAGVDAALAAGGNDSASDSETDASVPSASSKRISAPADASNDSYAADSFVLPTYNAGRRILRKSRRIPGADEARAFAEAVNKIKIDEWTTTDESSAEDRSESLHTDRSKRGRHASGTAELPSAKKANRERLSQSSRRLTSERRSSKILSWDADTEIETSNSKRPTRSSAGNESSTESRSKPYSPLKSKSSGRSLPSDSGSERLPSRNISTGKELYQDADTEIETSKSKRPSTRSSAGNEPSPRSRLASTSAKKSKSLGRTPLNDSRSDRLSPVKNATSKRLPTDASTDTETSKNKRPSLDANPHMGTTQSGRRSTRNKTGSGSFAASPSKLQTPAKSKSPDRAVANDSGSERSSSRRLSQFANLEAETSRNKNVSARLARNDSVGELVLDPLAELSSTRKSRSMSKRSSPSKSVDRSHRHSSSESAPAETTPRDVPSSGQKASKSTDKRAKIRSSQFGKNILREIVESPNLREDRGFSPKLSLTRLDPILALSFQEELSPTPEASARERSRLSRTFHISFPGKAAANKSHNDSNQESVENEAHTQEIPTPGSASKRSASQPSNQNKSESRRSSSRPGEQSERMMLDPLETIGSRRTSGSHTPLPLVDDPLETVGSHSRRRSTRNKTGSESFAASPSKPQTPAKSKSPDRAVANDSGSERGANSRRLSQFANLDVSARLARNDSVGGLVLDPLAELSSTRKSNFSQIFSGERKDDFDWESRSMSKRASPSKTTGTQRDRQSSSVSESLAAKTAPRESLDEPLADPLALLPSTRRSKSSFRSPLNVSDARSTSKRSSPSKSVNRSESTPAETTPRDVPSSGQKASKSTDKRAKIRSSQFLQEIVESPNLRENRGFSPKLSSTRLDPIQALSFQEELSPTPEASARERSRLSRTFHITSPGKAAANKSHNDSNQESVENEAHTQEIPTPGSASKRSASQPSNQNKSESRRPSSRPGEQSERMMLDPLETIGSRRTSGSHTPLPLVDDPLETVGSHRRQISVDLGQTSKLQVQGDARDLSVRSKIGSGSSAKKTAVKGRKSGSFNKSNKRSFTQSLLVVSLDNGGKLRYSNPGPSRATDSESEDDRAAIDENGSRSVAKPSTGRRDGREDRAELKSNVRFRKRPAQPPTESESDSPESEKSPEADSKTGRAKGGRTKRKTKAGEEFVPFAVTKTNFEHFLQKRVVRPTALEVHKQANRFFRMTRNRMDKMMASKPANKKFISPDELKNMFVEQGLFESLDHLEMNARQWLDSEQQQLVIDYEAAFQNINYD